MTRSHSRFTPLALATAVTLSLAVAFLPSAQAASPGAARTIGATTSKGYVGEFNGGHVALVVSADGRQVQRAFIGYLFQCTDNDSFTEFDHFRSIPLSALGSFQASYDSGKIPSQINPGGTFQYTGTMSGKRNKAKTKIIGTARFTFTTTSAAGEVLSCDTGLLRFTARD